MATPWRTPSADEVNRLAAGMGDWLARFARHARRVVLLMAVLASLTGVAALVAGLIAWHSDLPTVAVVLIVCLPPVVAPILVARRVRPLTQAVINRDETAAQARAYFATLKASPELDQLVERAVASDLRGAVPRGRGGLVRTGRSIASLMGKVSPDARTQPLLAAFSPVNLKTTWLALIVTWWLWMVALIFLTAASFAIAVDLAI